MLMPAKGRTAPVARLVRSSSNPCLLRHFQRVINFDAKMANRAFYCLARPSSSCTTRELLLLVDQPSLDAAHLRSLGQPGCEEEVEPQRAADQWLVHA